MTARHIDILYRDEHIVAVNKPAGMMVHRSRLAAGEKKLALQTVRDMIGRHVYPVHRLDKPASGVLVFGLHPGAASRLIASFAARAVKKTYLVVVRGFSDPEGTVDYPLTKFPDKKEPGNILQQAQTSYQRLAIAELPHRLGRFDTVRYSLLAVYPRTGRMHQIRRHFHHISHPVIGDTVYGDGRHNRIFRTQFNCRRLLLAAVEITFPHPYTGETITISAPMNDPFSTMLRRMGWESAIPAGWLEPE